MRTLLEFFQVVFYSLIGRQDEIPERLSPDQPLDRIARAEDLMGR